MKMSMVHAEWLRQKFEELHVCVIIPTYNNAATLGAVISDVSFYTSHVIVVNDGSTDNSSQIIQSFSLVQELGYQKNKGKGWALRRGFAYALEKGYQYAITIDSDGQHFAKDLPGFIHKLADVGEGIIIGSRNMDQDAVPGKSNFGNRFSNFWFRLETGISLPDTQSGYRLYPLAPLKKLSFFTSKYEFEIEVLVRCAWNGVKIESVPVYVYYPPKEERISHFRPIADFARISLLNSILVLATFFYIKPRNFFRSLFDREKGREYFNIYLFQNNQPDHIKSVSVGFGVFMGIIPIWGFQLIVAIFLSIIFKLNKALVILAAHISIIPMIPLIIYLSYKTGAYWMGANAMHLGFSRHITLLSIKKNFEQYLYGSITLAVAAGILSGLVTFLLLKLFKTKTATAA
jgi:glycosyltransferase involved in cell wall biosynthesis